MTGGLQVRRFLAATLLLFLFTPVAIFADEARPLADDPAVEKRLIAISSELRCLVCQNESLAGSRADLALDLRREVRGLIARGESDESIKQFLVSRYGDFILYRPPWKATTVLLWLGPLLLLAAGLLLLYPQLRRRAMVAAREPGDTELNDTERERLKHLLSLESGNSETPRA